MKLRTSVVHRLLATAVALLVVMSANAAFVTLPAGTPETPGASLGGLTTGLTGDVLIDTSLSFSLPANAYTVNTSGSSSLNPVSLTLQGNPITVPGYLVSRYLNAGATVGSIPAPTFAVSGALRFLAVDRGAGLQDFYFQIANTSPTPDPAGALDFFRFTIGGFDFGSEALSVAATNSLAGLTSAAGPLSFVGGTVAPNTADRDVALSGSIGFDFPLHPPVAFTSDPRNLNAGDLSNFLVVRTNRLASPLNLQLLISGSTTLAFDVVTDPGTLVPEPASALLVMLGLGAVTLLRHRRTFSA